MTSIQTTHRRSLFAWTSIFILCSFLGLSQKTSVYFKTNDYSLDNKTKLIIDSLSKINAIEKIYLRGHCDSIGNIDFNDALSNKRVNSVKAYFIFNKLSNKIFEMEALGKRFSINKNTDENERALNRRVEIEIIINTPKTEKKVDITSAEKSTPASSDELETIINGIVINEDMRPLIAEVSLYDKNGQEIKTIKSGIDGKYEIKATLNKNENYSLTYFSDNYFVAFKNINLSNKELPYENLKTILRMLDSGKKYILENMNFVGDTSQIISSSLCSLEALYKLMKKNERLAISIEGHVNFPKYLGNPKTLLATSDRYFPPGMTAAEYNQWLSEERAKMVYGYLIEKGIDAKRMSTIGFGEKRMLFPNSTNEAEKEQNRRVEINVISIK